MSQATKVTQHLPGGLPQTSVDPNGVTTNLTYDARLRLLTSTLTTSTGPLATKYAYDPAGNLLSVALPDGSALSNTYDAAHRLTATADLFTNSISISTDARLPNTARASSISLELAARLKAPVGYSFRGKQWLEHDNPNAVGMTGLLGYGGAYKAIHDADLLLMLGTDFPFSEFLPGDDVKKVQIDRNAKHIGRRTAIDLGLVGDIKATVTALLPKIGAKTDGRFLEKHVAETDSFYELLRHYVEKGQGIKPIRPEFLAATLSELASDDALFFADTGTACIRLARHIRGGPNRRLFGSFSWASMANAAPNAFGAQLAYPGRQTIALCGDGGFTMLGLGDLLTHVQRKTSMVQIILNNESLDFVNIEMQEAGVVPFGVDFKNPNFAKVAEAMGAKGIRIEEPGDVREGLAVALAHQGGPVVVDVVVDPYALSLPSHLPFHAVTGFTLSLAKQVLSGKMDSVIKTLERNTGLV